MPFQFNWGTPPFAGPDMSGGLSMGSAVPGSMSSLSSWGAGITAPTLAAPSAIGGIDVVPKIPGTGTGGINGQVFGGGLGLNMDTAKLALSGIGTLGNLWGAFQAAKLAKQQFNYTKDVTETNLANQLKTYNTQLTDRANNRAIVEGKTAAETAAYIDANKLSRYGR